MNEQKLPPGWDEERIRGVIDHYDSRDEDERAAEIEAAWEAEGIESLHNKITWPRVTHFTVPAFDQAYIRLCKPATFFMISV